MRARRDRHAHDQAGVGRVHVLFPLRFALRVAGEALGSRHAFAFAADREPFEQRAIETHVDLMRLAHPDQIEIELSLQDHLDAVVAVEREVIRDRDAAARSERQFVARAIVLRESPWECEPCPRPG